MIDIYNGPNEEGKKANIAIFLLSYYGATKTEVARFFGTSPRTIGRWIDKEMDFVNVFDIDKGKNIEFSSDGIVWAVIDCSDLTHIKMAETVTEVKEESQGDIRPEDIAPRLWAAYKDELNDEALAALEDVILNHEYLGCGFADDNNIEFAFRWYETSQGGDFWGNVSDGKYNKESTVDPLVPVNFILLPRTIVVVRDGEPHMIDNAHKFFNKIKQLLEENYTIIEKTAHIEESILKQVNALIDLKSGIEEYSNGKVKVTQNGVSIDGKIINNTLTERLLQALIDDQDEEALLGLTNFMSLLEENPSYGVCSRLYDFLDHNDVKIDKDGYILAYKAVASDYMDKYSRTYDNSPGKICEMPRNHVNDDAEQTCSYGLHACSGKGYLHSYYGDGDKIVLVKIHPQDVVSVPVDYNGAKLRACKYVVLEDVTDQAIKEFDL